MILAVQLCYMKVLINVIYHTVTPQAVSSFTSYSYTSSNKFCLYLFTEVFYKFCISNKFENHFVL